MMLRKTAIAGAVAAAALGLAMFVSHRCRNEHVAAPERGSAGIVTLQDLTPQQSLLLFKRRALWPPVEDIETHRPGPTAHMERAFAAFEDWLHRVIREKYLPTDIRKALIPLADYGPFEHVDDSGRYSRPSADYLLLRYEANGLKVEMVDDGAALHITLVPVDSSGFTGLDGARIKALCREILNLPPDETIDLPPGDVRGLAGGLLKVGKEPLPPPGKRDPETRGFVVPEWWQLVNCLTNGEWLIISIPSSNRDTVLRSLGHRRPSAMPVKRFMTEAELAEWSREWLRERAVEHRR